MHDLSSPPPIFKYSKHVLLAGAGGLLLSAFGWLCDATGWMDAGSFYRAYLFAWLFWLGISLGAMAITMLNHLTGGDWGLLIRRIGEAASLNIPVMMVLFIPIAFGLKKLYPWADPQLVAEDAVLQVRTALVYKPWFFLLRTYIYLSIWWFTALRVRSLSVASDKTVNPQPILNRLSGVCVRGLILYFVTMSLASVDWVMSLETHWYSSIYGFITIVGQGLSALAFMLMILRGMYEFKPFAGTARRDHVNDLGNLMLMFVILWAYMSFAQLLVTWMGNTQEDVVWYLQRIRGVWKVVSIVLIALHFFVPFLLLLSRDNKRRIEVLGTLGGALLLLHVLDVLYQVVPSGRAETLPDGTLKANSVTWIALVALIGIGGLWFAMFLKYLGAEPLLPIGQTVAADEHGHEHGHGEHEAHRAVG